MTTVQPFTDDLVRIRSRLGKMDRVHLGFALPVSGSWATPANIGEIARRAEDAGYASLWTFQRLLVAEDVPLPPQYASVLDPLAPLAFAAAVTSRIRLGTAIVNMPFQSPALLGKQLATLDVLSEGRLDAGLGLGWSPQEFDAVGTSYERRGVRAEEYLDCLRAVWGPDPVQFSGRFYSIPPSSILPKPVQQPAPPVLLGGGAEPALRRVGRLADGWISSSRADLSELGKAVATVTAAAEDAGRDPSGLRFVCRGVVQVGSRSGLLTGSHEQVRADLDRIAEQGITETFIDLNFDTSIGNPAADPSDSMQRALHTLRELAPSSASTRRF